MTQLNEAIARYHRLLENDNFKDLAWADALQQKLQAHHLGAGRRLAPVLRPHFVTQRQYTNLVRASEALYSAMDRMERMALQTPSLLARMAMLPAERMLASIDPGYSHFSVTSLLDTRLNNGTLHVVGCTPDTAAGLLYGETLNHLYYDAPPVREFRKKHPLVKPSGTKPLVQSLVNSWNEFGGSRKQPNIAIVEFRQAYGSTESGESLLLAELLRSEGYQVEVIPPDQLEYRNSILRHGAFEIDLIFRRVRVSEFLMRFDLNHPMVRAYREHKVCVVNSFRSELSQKRALFDLLTDETTTAHFPAAERKAIRDFLPWTRMVAATNTTYHDQPIDLPAFIQGNRERLVLKPNDEDGERQTYVGTELDEAGWERAVRVAMRGSYVVQEATKKLQCTFPLHRYGSVEMKEMTVDVQPHALMGKITGCSAYLTPAVRNGFSTVTGVAPTFILESK
ncbi:MAG TPA: hypothetical protein VES20_09650 [Bryobacteraceae bacterium]|nr:hypothetical protein [Bryobacteraceae bacterium]